MIEYVFIGAGFAFAAAIQPGPLQAFLLSSVAQRGWRRTLPASLSPLLSDGPIALLAIVVLNRVPETMSRVLQAGGGVLLLYLAWSSYMQWKRQAATESSAGGSAPRTFLQAATVNLLNPNPYLAWSLVLGPTALAAWSVSPTHALAFVLAFYLTIVTMLACTVLLFGTTRFLGPAARRGLILVSAVIMALLGVYQLVASVLRATVTDTGAAGLSDRLGAAPGAFLAGHSAAIGTERRPALSMIQKRPESPNGFRALVRATLCDRGSFPATAVAALEHAQWAIIGCTGRVRQNGARVVAAQRRSRSLSSPSVTVGASAGTDIRCSSQHTEVQA